MQVHQPKTKHKQCSTSLNRILIIHNKSAIKPSDNYLGFKSLNTRNINYEIIISAEWYIFVFSAVQSIESDVGTRKYRT